MPFFIKHWSQPINMADNDNFENYWSYNTVFLDTEIVKNKRKKVLGD
jgi:hypothetical protein